MNTSLRASRVGLASVALLAAVALTACGAASSGSGGGAAASSPCVVERARRIGRREFRAASAAGGAASTGAAAPATSAATSTVTVPSGGPVPTGFAASVGHVRLARGGVRPRHRPVREGAVHVDPAHPGPRRQLARAARAGGAAGGAVEVAGPAVWGIRFANPSDGFVFGNGLWETTDGGERWTPAASPGGSIESLEVIDGQVLAIAGTCTAQRRVRADRHPERRPLAGRRLAGGHAGVRPGAIATQARVAAVLDGDAVIVTANGGISTVNHSGPCSTAGIDAPVSLAVTGPNGLALLCAGNGAAGSVDKTVYVSDDLGAHWTKAGSPARGGDPEGMSAGSASQLVVAAASGASMLYHSADGGAQWTTAYYEGDGGLGFNDLGFTTPADGVVVYGPALSDNNAESRPGWLLLTSNGGASWQPVSF